MRRILVPLALLFLCACVGERSRAVAAQATPPVPPSGVPSPYDLIRDLEERAPEQIAADYPGQQYDITGQEQIRLRLPGGEAARDAVELVGLKRRGPRTVRVRVTQRNARLGVVYAYVFPDEQHPQDGTYTAHLDGDLLGPDWVRISAVLLPPRAQLRRAGDYLNISRSAVTPYGSSTYLSEWESFAPEHLVRVTNNHRDGEAMFQKEPRHTSLETVTFRSLSDRLLRRGQLAVLVETGCTFRPIVIADVGQERCSTGGYVYRVTRGSLRREMSYGENRLYPGVVAMVRQSRR